MGKRSRDKGQREERAIVHTWQDEGIAAERIPLSGAAGGSFSGDVTIPIAGYDRLFEAKARGDGSGFKTLYRWLGSNFGLFVRMDRSPRLVVLRESDFIDLCKRAGRAAQ